MNRKHLILVCIGALAAAALSGCGSNSVPGGEVPKEDIQTIAKFGDAARRAHGDFDKMTPEEQKMWLERCNGNLNTARKMVQIAARGPGGAPQ